MITLTAKGISKSFGQTQALKDISFSVDEGEILALLGPSGCGKSTLLSIIASLEHPDSGAIMWEGIDLANTPPHLRDFGLMFQDFALFPHMNVSANVAFGLKMAHLDPGRINDRVKEMLDLVGLPDLAMRDVNTLSGGEQQRVALARALAPHPRLLMLDEPLGSLDRNLRERLVLDLQRILHQTRQTAIYVTHDQEEAFTIADRIILINSGRIEQTGTPQQIYGDPASIFVARFLDMTNFIPGVVRYQDGRCMAVTSLGNIPLHSSQEGDITILVRPDMAQLDDKGAVVLTGIFMDISFRGSRKRITVLVNQTQLVFEFPSLVNFPDLGSSITISLDPDKAIKIYPAQ